MVQSMDDDTRPRPPSNAHYLFRSVRIAIAWALVGLLACLATWAVLIGVFLWLTR